MILTRLEKILDDSDSTKMTRTHHCLLEKRFFPLKRRDNDITIERPISKRAVLSRGSNDNWLSSLIRSEVMVAQRFASHLWKMLVKRYVLITGRNTHA